VDEIEELGRRIFAAFERISTGLATAQAPFVPDAGTDGRDAGAVRALEEALDAERTTNAQLTERVRAIREKQETVIAALERNVARLTQQLDAQGRELARQRRVNADLTETNRMLSTAAQSGRADGMVIDRAMASELDALRAARAAEMAELDEILSELKPLIGEVA
jgi:small-conductance mechanosensitive channel